MHNTWTLERTVSELRLDAQVAQAHAVLFVPCFFFQAEDGIRDVAVTGVQTCALPIFGRGRRRRRRAAGAPARGRRPRGDRMTANRLVTIYSRALAIGGLVALAAALIVDPRDRESGGEGKRGDLGGRRVIKKKKKTDSGAAGRGSRLQGRAARRRPGAGCDRAGRGCHAAPDDAGPGPGPGAGARE